MKSIDEEYKGLCVPRAVMVQARIGKLQRQFEAQGRALKLYPVALGMLLVIMALSGLVLFGAVAIPLLPLTVSLAVPTILLFVMYAISHSQD